MSKQINIREELNKRDMNSCTTDFVNMYECANLSKDKKKSLVKLLSENVSNKKLSEFFKDASVEYWTASPSENDIIDSWGNDKEAAIESCKRNGYRYVVKCSDYSDGDVDWEIVWDSNIDTIKESIDYSNDDYLFKPYWYFTRHGVGPGSVPNYIHVLGVVDADNGSYFASDKVIQTKDLEEYELKEQTPNADDIDEKVRINIQNWLEDPIEENLSSKKLKEALSATKLEQEIRNTIRNVFKGYDEQDYNDIIGDYLVIDIEPQNGRTRVEVRAELGYNSMDKIADALNPIVQRIDKDAYFDHDTSGIISAYINKSLKENIKEDETLKEEYGYYKDEPYCEEIADSLENGTWTGETSNGTSWELTINGDSSDEFSPSFANYLAEEVAYPVRDGHLAYIGIEMILYKSSMESIFGYDELDKLIPDLIKLDVDRETIDEWLSSSDPDAELITSYNFNIAFDVDEWEENNREDVDLPTEVTYDFYSLVDDDVDINSDDYNLDDVISDRLSDDYGYTHLGFDYDVDAESGDVYVYDIKWDISESLKESVPDNKYNIRETEEEIFDTLGIEPENYENSKHLLPQFRKLARKWDENSIWLKSDLGHYVKGKVVDETEDLVVVDEDLKESHTNSNKQPLKPTASTIDNEDLEEDYTHFTYKSGANPYIAKTDKEAKRILNKYKGKVKETKKGFYEIDDTDMLPPKPNYLGDE